MLGWLARPPARLRLIVDEQLDIRWQEFAGAQCWAVTVAPTAFSTDGA